MQHRLEVGPAFAFVLILNENISFYHFIYYYLRAFELLAREYSILYLAEEQALLLIEQGEIDRDESSFEFERDEKKRGILIK